MLDWWKHPAYPGVPNHDGAWQNNTAYNTDFINSKVRPMYIYANYTGTDPHTGKPSSIDPS